MPPNLVNFGPETAEEVGEFPPLNIRIWRHFQFYRMNVINKQQAIFGTCYVVARAYSLEQQNAGRAHFGLCHASIWFQVICQCNVTARSYDLKVGWECVHCCCCCY